MPRLISPWPDDDIIPHGGTMILTRGRGLAALLLAAAPLAAQDIPVVERTLPNGMRLVIATRHA